jgi:hypothetical protein
MGEQSKELWMELRRAWIRRVIIEWVTVAIMSVLWMVVWKYGGIEGVKRGLFTVLGFMTVHAICSKAGFVKPWVSKSLEWAIFSLGSPIQTVGLLAMSVTNLARGKPLLPAIVTGERIRHIVLEESGAYVFTLNSLKTRKLVRTDDGEYSIPYEVTPDHRLTISGRLGYVVGFVD